MKSKLTRIMGVTLALVLVFSLGAAFMPATTPGGPDTAEAGDLSWSTIGFPTGTGSVLVGAAEDLGPVAISPNFATDNTVWASVVDVTTPANPVVYKSTNGGHTWTATTSALGAAAGDYVVELKPSPNYAEDNTIFVVTQTNAGGANTGRVYRSVNGGSSFGQMGIVTLIANEVITCFDVSPTYDGTGVLAVGTADVRSGTQATAATCVQQWGGNGVLSWAGIAAGATTDISALVYSPNFTIDSTILVVASDGAGAMATNNPYLRAIVGGVWDNITATLINATGAVAVQVDFADTANAAATNAILRADIALPSDYNGQVSTTRRAYVSIVNNSGGGPELGNIYRVTNVTAGTDITNSIALQFSNLEYRGDFAEGTLLAGYWAAAGVQSDVYRTTNPTSSVVNWYGVAGAANQPTGTSGVTANTTAFIAAAVDFATSDTPTVVVGTMGNDSAFGASIDGAVSFNERGLIDQDAGGQGAGGEDALGTLSDLAITPNYATGSYLYLVTENDSAAASNTSVWRRDKSSGLWERCFTAAFNAIGTGGVIACSNEFATDSTLYVGDFNATAIYYSANAGQSWSARAVAAGLGVTIQTVAATDATTVYVGDRAGVGNIAKSTNSGWTWPSSYMKNSGATAPVVSLKTRDSTLVVGGSGGTVRRSDDGGSTWAKVSATLGGAAATFVDFDGTTVYAADSGTGNVYRSVDAGGWKEIGAASTATDAIELIMASDGTLYVADDADFQDVYRSINPTAAVPTPDATFQSMAAPLRDVAGAGGGTNVNVMDVVSGSNEVAIIDATPTIRMYTDILSAGTAGPNLVSPADGSTLTRAQTTRYTIEAMPGVTLYGHQWATDSTFTSGVTTTVITAPSVQTAGIAVTEGATVYWRVRATAPFNSPFSEVWTVETQITTAVQAPAPTYPGGLAGSTVNVPIDLVFNWGAFKYASGYEFQLANDSGMSDLIADMTGDSALGNVTSYKTESSLAYDSTYYWRVRAIKGTATAYSDWSAVVGFTTESKPVEPTPTVIVEPTPTPAPTPAPTTPAYIWAVIAIGAVLVIVVVVLIVRTRRP